MRKLSYIQLCQQLDPLIIKMAFAVNSEDFKKFRTTYLSFIDASGWTEEDFENETLKNIDGNWTDKGLN